MFSFPVIKNPDDVRRILNAELRLQQAIASNAIDVAFRLTDLNLYALKQATSTWSEKTETWGHTDTQTPSDWIEASTIKKSLEHFSAYGQQFNKIMLDMQGEFAKIAQRRAQYVLDAEKEKQATSQTDAPALNASVIEMTQTILDQTSKWYAQWAGNTVQTMQKMESDLKHAANDKNSAQALKPHGRK